MSVDFPSRIYCLGTNVTQSNHLHIIASKSWQTDQTIMYGYGGTTIVDDQGRTNDPLEP